MPQQTVEARLKEQTADLTKRERDRWLRIVNESIERYGKIREIQKGATSSVDTQRAHLWCEAKRGLEASLDKLKSFFEIPPLFQGVIDMGPSFHVPDAAGIPVRVKWKWKQGCKQAFDEAANKAQLFLEDLRRVLRRTTPKGEPGRKRKYPEALRKVVRRLHEKGETWRDVYTKCKLKFPEVVGSTNFNSFKRRMQTILKQGV